MPKTYQRIPQYVKSSVWQSLLPRFPLDGKKNPNLEQKIHPLSIGVEVYVKVLYSTKDPTGAIQWQRRHHLIGAYYKKCSIEEFHDINGWKTDLTQSNHNLLLS
jgi:hypothetical protein